MADLRWCKRCDAPIYPHTREPHACPPTWAAWVPDYGEDESDARDVFGDDPEDAAERHVRGFDLDSTRQLLGEGYLVHVRDGDKVVRVRVRGEATIDYTAETEEDDGGGAGERRREAAVSAPDLYWHCLQCGAHDPVEPTGAPDESYALGDWEKCIDCGGQAHVVTLRLGAAYEQGRALGLDVAAAWERAKSAAARQP